MKQLLSLRRKAFSIWHISKNFYSEKFKESGKFKERLQESGMIKSTVYVKIKLVKVLEKYRKLKRSLPLLNLLRIT